MRSDNTLRLTMPFGNAALTSNVAMPLAVGRVIVAMSCCADGRAAYVTAVSLQPLPVR